MHRGRACACDPVLAGRDVAVLGGLGPFAGTVGFVIEQRRRRQKAVSRLSLTGVIHHLMAVSSGTVQVVMPAMGDSVAEGTVLEWHKQEGDAVAADETLVEISTDKVDAEVPSPVSGTIVKIHAAEGETVAVGAVLAEISTDGDVPAAGTGGGGAAAVATPVSAESPPATPAEAVAGAATEAEGTAAAQAATGQTIDIVTPTGGESVTEGTILEWAVKVGDAVKDGDTVVEISTDKVDMELPAPATGTITEILAQDGETVSVGQVIARMTAGAAARQRRERRRVRRRTPVHRRPTAWGPSSVRATAAQCLAGRPSRRRRSRASTSPASRQRPGRPDHQGRRPRGSRQRRPARSRTTAPAGGPSRNRPALS